MTDVRTRPQRAHLPGPARGTRLPARGRAGPGGAARPRATFGQVFAVGEFRALWASVVLSAAGDRLALVALTLLVYDRTRSPLLAAAAYAAGYLPWVIGGLFLSDVADRRPRRTVMVGCDVGPRGPGGGHDRAAGAAGGAGGVAVRGHDVHPAG